jgi:hypothetical protein
MAAGILQLAASCAHIVLAERRGMNCVGVGEWTWWSWMEETEMTIK